VKRNRRFRRVKVTADGEGLVSRAGVALLRELTVDTGLADGWTDVLLDTYKAAPAAHLPGRVLADLAVVIADGGDALAHLATLRDQDKLFGTVASDATAWRCVERVDDEHLVRLQAVRSAARERAWAAGAGPDLRDGLVIDIDATITIAHSEKENAASTGFRPFAKVRCNWMATSPVTACGSTAKPTTGALRNNRQSPVTPCFSTRARRQGTPIICI
jgi:hypothetical protein